MKRTEEQQLVSPLRGRRFPAEVLTNEEVSSLVRGCSSRAPTGVRNAALIAVLYRAGLRVSEALGLFPKDLDAGLGTLRVLEGKGGKSRTVALDDAALALIGRWLDPEAKARTEVISEAVLDAPGDTYAGKLHPRVAATPGSESRNCEAGPRTRAAAFVCGRAHGRGRAYQRDLESSGAFFGCDHGSVP